MVSVDDFINGIKDFLEVKSDRASIIFAFSIIEQFVTDLVKDKSRHPSAYEGSSIYVKTCILHDLDVLNDSEFEKINWLRKCRNGAAHSSGFKVDESEFKDNWIMKGIENAYDSRIKSFLVTLVGSLWNQHEELRGHYKL